MSATDYLPKGLNPGETFQLAFVTNSGREASSTLISDYNGFVQDQWNGSSLKTLIETYLRHPNITFNCIGSTATVDASVNAVVGSGSGFKGVYKLNQEKIADDYDDMWDGSIDSPLNITAEGRAPHPIGDQRVWTGADASGGEGVDPTFPPDPAPLGSLNPIWGRYSNMASGWIDNGGNAGTAALWRLYALSEILTWVPCSVGSLIIPDANYKKRFPYGRWNNTSSNQKLFKMTFCTGPSGKVITNRTRNLFKNTANRQSSKQVFSYLIKNGIGPNTR